MYFNCYKQRTINSTICDIKGRRRRRRTEKKKKLLLKLGNTYPLIQRKLQLLRQSPLKWTTATPHCCMAHHYSDMLRRINPPLNLKVSFNSRGFDHRVCFIRNILGKRSDLPFSRKGDRKKEKSVVSLMHEQNITEY